MGELHGEWKNCYTAGGKSYDCGFCGSSVGPSFYYSCQGSNGYEYGSIYLCPNCNKPTFFQEGTGEQVPGSIFGEDIEHLPEDIDQLYSEARKCLSVNAFTSAVLSCRKLLMNVSVSKGADPGKSFVSYVTFLEENHFVPPGSNVWVDHIRKKGNEATHEIPSITRDDAIELLEFTEMLLRFVYELPGKMARHTT
ncbi:DUF4145 domain-containing protein [Cytobacillus firmus]|uniref:DUF4145 domain-containing protein n=1 Tax=Cytobacillus firmus TaxID=1399 RepID=UPI00216342C9|nr:DUF4145 domain-containing protein [Cytobacillus firmus]MCS0652016.1 DUF4145 domain-containing protein [Cytobacillus firmus]